MFDNFVSLGPACPTAESMSKFGLRSWSGPFDWIVSINFKQVMYFMENNFEGFLLKENLEPMAGGFRDTRTGFSFPHDEYFSDEDFDEIKHKYERRINRFLEETKKKTCFLRVCNDADEIIYISEKFAYIDWVVKKNNHENKIIFLLKKDIEFEVSIPFDYYVLRDRYSSEALRNCFDNSTEFLDYCGRNYNTALLLKNIVFDQKKQETISEIKTKRYQTLLKLFNFDYNKVKIPENIIIYGAGNIGITFYKLIRNRTGIIYFVDKKKVGSEIEGIPVKRLGQFAYKKEMTFIITATYDYENIYSEIKKYYCDAKIVSLDMFL